MRKDNKSKTEKMPGFKFFFLYYHKYFKNNI